MRSQQLPINSEQQVAKRQDQTKGPWQNMFPQIRIKKWELYAKRRGRHAQNQNYQESIEPLVTIQNLEEFFKYYNKLKLPSEYEVDVKIMLFEEGCSPCWENWLESGCFLIHFKEEKQSKQLAEADAIWQLLTFSLIGNQLDADIIGLILSRHEKLILFEVWLRNISRKKIIGRRIEQEIQKHIQNLLMKVKNPIKLSFKQHRLSKQNKSTIKGSKSLGFIQKNRNNSVELKPTF